MSQRSVDIKTLPIDPDLSKKKENHDSLGVRSDLPQVSRRAFLGFLTSAVGLAAVTSPGDASAQESQNRNDSSVNAATENFIKEKESSLPEWIDYSTAGVILLEFIRHVGWRVAWKNEQLNMKSALEMNALAQGRIAVLRFFGGDEGKKLADKEQHEIVHGLLPVPILVALSEVTTEVLRVNEQAIFEEVKGALNDSMDYRNIERPNVGDEIVRWQEHLEKTNKDLVTKTAQIAGITSLLAPLMTTYTSSAIANKMKADVLRILYEQSYAKAVLEEKEKLMQHEIRFETVSRADARGEGIINEDEIKLKAKERAEFLFNGPSGFSKLMLTLAANVQGCYGAGDPPELYCAINHHDDPSLLALSHAFGAGYSHLSTHVLNLSWLRDADAFSPQFISQFFASEYQTLKALFKTSTSGTLKNVFDTLKGNSLKSQIGKALEKKGLAGAVELREVLKKIPDSYFQFRLGEHIAAKIENLSRLQSRKDHLVGLLDKSDLDTEDGFASSSVFQELLDAQKKGDMSEMQRCLKVIEKALQSKQVTRVTELLEGMLEEDDKVDGFFVRLKVNLGFSQMAEEHAIENAKEHGDISEKVEQSLSAASTIAADFLTLDEVEQEQRLVQARNILNIDAKMSAEEVRKILSQTGQDTVLRAIAQLTEVEGKHDAVAGLEDPHKPQEKGSQKPKGKMMGVLDKKIKILEETLGHSAREVLWALLTQIPSVPALSRLAELSLSAAVGVDGGVPTAEQLKKIISYLLVIEAGKSGFADNVAANMFAEGLLIAFFTKRYGKNIINKRPSLKRKIVILAKLIAEIFGSLTILGNGPNFSQEKCVIVDTNDNAQGIDIDRQKASMSETLPWHNRTSFVWSAATCYAAIDLLHREIDSIEDDLLKEKQEPAGVIERIRKNIFSKAA